MMENKKSKFGLGVLVGLLVAIIIGLTAFIVYDKVLLKDNEQVENNDISQDTSLDENDEESLPDFDISKFDTTKEAINENYGLGYQLVPNDVSTMGLFIELDKNKNSAIITIDWSKYGKIDGIQKKYVVTNFTKKIRDVYINGFGQAAGQETAFYIMEDGTVEYTPIIDALWNNESASETKSYGKIKDASGVVKIVTATDYSLNNETNFLGGSYNILGIKSDGSFYNLSRILIDTDYYGS